MIFDLDLEIIWWTKISQHEILCSGMNVLVKKFKWLQRIALNVN